MELIDKAAVVEEIERRKHKLLDHIICESDKEWVVRTVHQLNRILLFLDTLEVKEVDLEDSIKETFAQKYIDYTFKRHNIDPESREGQLIYYAYMHGMNQCLNQLKAQKGEEV